MTGHVVGDEGEGNALPLKLPGGQPRTLEERSGLVDEYVEMLPLLVCRPDDAERRAVLDGRERSGVAVGEDPRPVGDQVGAVLADRPTHRHVLGGDAVRLQEEASAKGGDRRRVRGGAETPVERPGEVHGGRAGRAELVRSEAQVGQGGGHLPVPLESGEREAVGGGDPDGGRAADLERANRLGDLTVLAAMELDQLGREASLVDQDEVVVSPPEALHRAPILRASSLCRSSLRAPSSCASEWSAP